MRNIAITLLALFTSTALWSQSIRTFVSTSGNDANPCSKLQPCRNFAAAIDAASSGGEVIVLDSGGYGPVTITKNISVIAPEGVHAAIAPSGTAITVSLGLAGRVALRNLYLNGPRDGSSVGVLVSAGQFVSMERCVIAGFLAGVQITAPNSRTFIDQTIFRDNDDGILSDINGVAATVVSRSDFQRSQIVARRGTRMTITSSAISDSETAVLVQTASATTNGRSEVTIVDSVLTGTGSNLGVVSGGASGTALVAISRTTIVNFGAGIQINSNGTVRLDGCTITRNGTGVQHVVGLPGTSLQSRQNNFIVGNTIANVSGLVTPVPGT